VQNKDYLYDGKVYVLTSNQTFSSATMFSVYLQDNGFAKVIGEPSGNSPSAYGDVLTFQLPNSKLMFQTTFKYFKRPDISKDSIKTQVPDYAVPAEDAINELKLIIKKE
jgi:C-terminal processing protease CtpA/Prc